MKNKLSLALVICILLLAAFLRLYNISDYMTFLGDEGRDVLIVKGMLEGDLTFLGPRSSAGDFFMGPAYYYMMAPALFLSGLDPVGPAIMVALIGVATTFLVYFIGKRFFSERAGLFAAALYASSPLVIVYSRSSWNPNVLPFFALLLMYTTFKGVGAKHPWKYLVPTGMLLGIAIQLHYLSLFLIGIVTLYIFFGLWYSKGKIQVIEPIKNYLQILLGFLITLLPFLAFEARHGFPNFKSIFSFIFGDTLQDTGYQHDSSFSSHIIDIVYRLSARLVLHSPLSDISQQYSPMALNIWYVVAALIALASVAYLFLVKDKRVVLLLSLWLFVSIFLFGVYKKEINDYHMVILFPLPFLLVGNFLANLGTMGKKKWHMFFVLLSFVLFFSLFIFSLSDAPFRFAPNKQKWQVQQTAEFLLKQTGNKPFNFALLSPANSDHGYRYYFSYYGQEPVVIENPGIDPDRKTVTDQLFVICEGACAPLGNSLWEIAGYGRADIVKEWSVPVGKIYKLKKYQGVQ